MRSYAAPMTAPTSAAGVHESLVGMLRAEGVDFRLTHHDPVTTSADAAAARGAELRSGAKAMLVKGKTGFVLAVLAADRKVDWKLLAPLVGGKGARFANDDELSEATGLGKVRCRRSAGSSGCARSTTGACSRSTRSTSMPARTPTRLRCRERT